MARDAVGNPIPAGAAGGEEDEEVEGIPPPTYTPPDWVLDGVPNGERDARIAALVRALDHGFEQAAAPPTREEREARALQAAAGEQKRERGWARMYGSGN